MGASSGMPSMSFGGDSLNCNSPSTRLTCTVGWLAKNGSYSVPGCTNAKCEQSVKFSQRRSATVFQMYESATMTRMSGLSQSLKYGISLQSNSLSKRTQTMSYLTSQS